MLFSPPKLKPAQAPQVAARAQRFREAIYNCTPLHTHSASMFAKCTQQGRSTERWILHVLDRVPSEMQCLSIFAEIAYQCLHEFSGTSVRNSNCRWWCEDQASLSHALRSTEHRIQLPMERSCSFSTLCSAPQITSSF